MDLTSIRLQLAEEGGVHSVSNPTFDIRNGPRSIGVRSSNLSSEGGGSNPASTHSQGNITSTSSFNGSRHKVTSIDVKSHSDLDVPSFSPRKSGRFTKPPTQLAEVLWNGRPFPYNRETFRQYLASTLAEENLAFWVSAVDYKQQYEGFHGPKGEKIYVEESRASTTSDKLSQLDAALAILDSFIRDGAIEQINISSSERKKIVRELELAEKQNERAPVKGVFNNAIKEVERIMDGRFQSFLDSVASQNLSDSEANFRTFGGIVTLLIVSTIHFCLRYVAEMDRFVVSGITAIPFGFVVYLIISSRNKLCSGRALSGTRMDVTASCFKARNLNSWIDLMKPQKHLCAARSCDQGILDEYALHRLKRAGQKQLALVILVTIIVVVGLGALPPHDDLQEMN